MGRVRRSKDDDSLARPHHPSLRNPRCSGDSTLQTAEKIRHISLSNWKDLDADTGNYWTLIDSDSILCHPWQTKFRGRSFRSEPWFRQPKDLPLKYSAIGPNFGKQRAPGLGASRNSDRGAGVSAKTSQAKRKVMNGLLYQKGARPISVVAMLERL